MTRDRRRLALLRRLEALRGQARDAAAAQVAQAEGALTRVAELAARTAAMHGDYAARDDAGDGAELKRLAAFGAGLHTLARNAQADLASAGAVADARQRVLADAERARAMVAERTQAQARRIARNDAQAAFGAGEAVPRNGTGLE